MNATWNGKPIPPFATAAMHPYQAIPDYMSQSGARDLAAMLLTVWHANGHSNVTAEVVSAGKIGNQSVWEVKTNLIGGLPPRIGSNGSR
jgi:hypothetical protein